MKKPPGIVWDPGKSAQDNAAEILPAMARRLFGAGRRLARGKPKLKRLHEFRLQVKQFRYTLELFEPLYGAGLSGRLAKLRELQQRLGRINDCVATRALVGAAGDLAGAARVLKHIERAQRRRVAGFVRFWNKEFDGPGEEEAWVECLRHPRADSARTRPRRTASPALPPPRRS